MTVPLWAWIAAVGGLGGLLAGDIALHYRRDLDGVRRALIETTVWISLSAAFGILLGVTSGWGISGQYFSGYLLEKSLSVDNVVAFALLFRGFRVSQADQRLVLYWGVVGALALRGMFIAAGAALVEQVSWAFYPFGMIVLLAGLRMARGSPEIDLEHGRIVRAIRRLVRVTSASEGGHFVIREDGRRVGTQLLLALVAIEVTDVVFAADSIPAVFGVTTNVFVVFTSNAFAVLGLRSLYFVLAEAMDRLVHLTKGLAVLLVLIGIKMLIRPVIEIPTAVTLAVIAVVVTVSIVVSMRRHNPPPPGV